MFFGPDKDKGITVIISNMRKGMGSSMAPGIEGSEGYKEVMSYEDDEDYRYIKEHMANEAELFSRAMFEGEYMKMAEHFKMMFHLCKEAEQLHTTIAEGSNPEKY